MDNSVTRFWVTEKHMAGGRSAFVSKAGNEHRVEIGLVRIGPFNSAQECHNYLAETALPHVIYQIEQERVLGVGSGTLTALRERDEALERVAALEQLRPHWAKGYTSDSATAQAATAALTELWKLLGVENQTMAVLRLRAMLAEPVVTASEDNPTDEQIEILRDNHR